MVFTTTIKESVDLHNVAGSNTEKTFMGLWCLLTSFFAFTGNVMVLYASIKHNAIKLDKISSVLIKNIALADIGYSIYIVITFVSIVNDGWVFGNVLCDITNYMHLFFGIAEIYLICALNVSKLHVLLFPMQARVRSAKSGQLIAIAMWSIMPVFHMIPAIILGRVQTFRLSFYRCEGYFTGVSKIEKFFPMYAALCFVIMPMLVVVIAIIWLFYYVRKVQGLQKQTIVTLLLISLCYFCSYLPYGVYYIMKAVVPAIESNVPISLHYYRFSLFMCYLNFSANPVIYIVTVKSYQEFLKDTCIATKNIVKDAKTAVTHRMWSSSSGTS